MDTPAKRNWTVNCFTTEYVPQEGGYVQRTVANPHARAELDDLLDDLAGVCERCGGTVAIIAERARIADDEFVPYRFLVRWEAFANVVDLRPEAAVEPSPEEDPAPEPELEAAPA